MTRHYEITDGNLHVGWASEDYMFTKMDERVLKGEANFNFHVDDGDAVDVAPVKHGHWIWNEDEWNHQCSVCKERFDYSKTYELFDHGFQMAVYCPCCGAKMDEEVEDEDIQR